jgi:hypothetical protein
MNEKIIHRIVNFVNQNGDRFRMMFTINYAPFPVAQKLVSEIVSEHGSVFNYINQFVNDLNPNSVVVTVKKKNGTGSGRDPKTEKFNFHKMTNIPAQAEQPEKYYRAEPMEGLGSPKTGSLKEQYDFHLGMITREANKFESELAEYKSKYKKEKKARQKLQLAYDTQEEKHNFQLKMAELEGKNSLSGIVQEVMPHVKDLAGDFIASKSNSSQQALEGNTDERISNLIEALRLIKDENQIQFYYETMVRMASLTPENLPVFMKHLRELTPNTQL